MKTMKTTKIMKNGNLRTIFCGVCVACHEINIYTCRIYPYVCCICICIYMHTVAVDIKVR